jgi:hypothetical protein
LLEQNGVVYDYYIRDATDDLIEYFQKNPQLLNLNELKNVNRCFFQQIEYHGTIFTIEFIKEDEIIIKEKRLISAFREIHQIKFDKIFADTASEIMYLMKLNQIIKR